MRRPLHLATLALCLAAAQLTVLPVTRAQDATPVASLTAGISGPLFADVTEAALTSPQPCRPAAPAYEGAPSPEGCYSHYIRLADLDGDGDLEIVFANGGGYFTAAGEEGLQPLVVYRNDGPAADRVPGFTDVSAEAVGGFLGRVRQVAIGDVDGDRDLDLYAPGSWGETDALFINDGRGIFVDEAATRLPSGLASRAGATRLGDVDGDGDLDLVVTDWGKVPPITDGTAHLYQNDGAGSFIDVTGQLPVMADAPGSGPVDIDVLDVDNDGDLDLILNNRDGRNLLWLNDGSGTFTDATESQLPVKPSDMSYDVEPCDIDADGDLDLWVDNAGLAAAEQLLINDGAGTFRDESEQRITGNPPGDDNEVNCADIDGDGDFDAVIAALQGIERVLVNDGAGHFATMLDAFPNQTDPSLSMELGDLNGDAILDAVTAQGESLPQLNRVYTGVTPAAVDTRAPVLRFGPVLTSSPGEPGIVIFALSDNATTDGGPRLGSDGAFIEWQTNGGELTRAEATFVGGDLFRAILPALPAGTELMVRVGATDLAGNELLTPVAPVSAAATPAGVSGTPVAATPTA